MQTTTWETQTTWKVARTDPEKARALLADAVLRTQDPLAPVK